MSEEIINGLDIALRCGNSERSAAIVVDNVYLSERSERNGLVLRRLA